MKRRYDTVIIGAGHNALVAASYLGRAGRSVLIVERSGEPGGAAVSEQAFDLGGPTARLSRFSYLVSLLPDRLIRELGLGIELRSRSVASYTPTIRDGESTGLLVEREPGTVTEDSFRALTGGPREYDRWREFYGELLSLAGKLAPTMLEPLRSEDRIRALVGESAYDRFVARPLGEVVEATFADDLVRGVVLTDGLIGTFTHAHDPALLQNRCFLYHLIGNGTGEWRVPVGGMGAVTAELVRVARASGVELRTGAEVVRLSADGRKALMELEIDGTRQTVDATSVLCGAAPAVLDRLLGRPTPNPPEGSQVKVNLLLERLPRLRSGADPRQAFAGTFHVAEGYAELQQAYDQAAAGRFPAGAPSELYCHTLTDPSILDAELVARGWHTVTLFGLHTPARLFAEPGESDGQRRPNRRPSHEELARSYLDALNAHLAEPIEDCLARDIHGRPCVEVRDPLDIQAAVGMPGGHIFHGDLAWPWAETPSQQGTWGVETNIANVLLCGAGARRGGGVSGIAGHNAAHALLASDA